MSTHVSYPELQNLMNSFRVGLLCDGACWGNCGWTLQHCCFESLIHPTVCRTSTRSISVCSQPHYAVSKWRDAIQEPQMTAGEFIFSLTKTSWGHLSVPQWTVSFTSNLFSPEECPVYTPFSSAWVFFSAVAIVPRNSFWGHGLFWFTGFQCFPFLFSVRNEKQSIKVSYSVRFFHGKIAIYELEGLGEKVGWRQ